MYVMRNRSRGADIPKGSVEAIVYDEKGISLRRMIRPVATLQRYVRRYRLEAIAPAYLLYLWRQAES